MNIIKIRIKEQTADILPCWFFYTFSAQKMLLKGFFIHLYHSGVFTYEKGVPTYLKKETIDQSFLMGF